MAELSRRTNLSPCASKFIVQAMNDAASSENRQTKSGFFLSSSALFPLHTKPFSKTLLLPFLSNEPPPPPPPPPVPPGIVLEGLGRGGEAVVQCALSFSAAVGRFGGIIPPIITQRRPRSASTNTVESLQKNRSLTTRSISSIT